MAIAPVLPVAGRDYPRTFRELKAWFPNEPACLGYLARLRWPDGFVCPRCKATAAWQLSRGLWRCASCRKETSVTAGTSSPAPGSRSRPGSLPVGT